MTFAPSDFGVAKFKALIPAATFAAVIESLMGVLSSVVAGNLLGSDALSAVNLSMPVMNAVTFFAALVGIGTAVNYSHFSGRCETVRAHEFFTQGLWTALMLGGFAMAAILFGSGAFIAYLDPGAAIAGEVKSYLLWFTPCALLEPLVILLVNSVMLDGDSRLCFASYCLQLAANAVLSFSLVGRLGVAGCAISTVAANAVAAAVLSLHFFRSSNSLRIVRHFSVRDSLAIMGSSVGDAATFVCSAALFFLLNKFVLANYGSGAVPVLAVVICAISMLEFFNGVGNALGPVLGVYFGENNPDAVIRLLGRAVTIALVEGAIASLALIACPSLVVRVIGLTDPAMAAAAVSATRLVALGFVAHSLVYLFNSYFVFVGHPALAFSLTVCDGLAVPALLIWVFGDYSPEALWLVIGLAPVFVVFMFGFYLTVAYGRKGFPHLLDCSRRGDIVSFSLALAPEEIAAASEEVGRLMAARGVPSTEAMKAALMTEEVFMSVRDFNRAPVRGEVVLDFTSRPRLILRDDGTIFDITDVNREVSSLRAYLVASVMESHDERRHLVTTGFNRNIFVFSR